MPAILFDYSYYITTGTRLPLLQRNNFGGSFGGPIKKDKTFFYAVYEELKQNQGATVLDTTFPANCYGSNGQMLATGATRVRHYRGGVVPAAILLLAAQYAPPKHSGH